MIVFNVSHMISQHRRKNSRKKLVILRQFSSTVITNICHLLFYGCCAKPTPSQGLKSSSNQNPINTIGKRHLTYSNAPIGGDNFPTRSGSCTDE